VALVFINGIIPFIKSNDTKALTLVCFSIVIVTPIGGATLVVLLPYTKRLKSLPPSDIIFKR